MGNQGGNEENGGWECGELGWECGYINTCEVFYKDFAR